jgi:hypothetical protein
MRFALERLPLAIIRSVVPQQRISRHRHSMKATEQDDKSGRSDSARFASSTAKKSHV